MCFGQRSGFRTLCTKMASSSSSMTPRITRRPSRSARRLSKPRSDRRWIRINRPTVVVGGELTMDNLEIRYDARRATPAKRTLQMKSNCGCC